MTLRSDAAAVRYIRTPVYSKAARTHADQWCPAMWRGRGGGGGRVATPEEIATRPQCRTCA